MPTITFIGGGSAKFVCQLVRDAFTFERLHDSRIVLMDIDGERAQRSARLVTKLIGQLSIPATVEWTTDRRKAVAGADYVIVTVMCGGFPCYRSDTDIPRRHGVLPTVGDTVGPGSVFRLVRTWPLLSGLVQDLRELAPRAWVLNYTNPMAMCTWSLLDAGWERSIGLCHSIQGMHRELARWLGLPPDELHYTAGGINHIDFYLTLTHQGRDVYPDLLAKREAIIAKHPEEKVRFALLAELGHFPAEGAHHQSEYSPWFRKDEATALSYGVETGWGYAIDTAINQRLVAEVEEQLAGRAEISLTRSHEYGAFIIDALQGGEPQVFYGNVRNRGLIGNLPPDAVVEVPCHADRNGVVAGRIGDVPLPLAAVMSPHIHLHRQTVAAVRAKDKRLLYHAVRMDPLTSAILTLPQIRTLVDEMCVANAAWMGDWKA